MIGKRISSGRAGAVPLACCRSKSGDSSIVVRAMPTLPASTAPTRKGMRHHHEFKFAELSELTVSKKRRPRAAPRSHWTPKPAR